MRVTAFDATTLFVNVMSFDMRHDIDWKKVHCKVGQRVPVYPFSDKVQPFIGEVKRIKMNRYGRVSYVIDDKEVMAEELLPAKNQTKLKMRVNQ